MVHQFMLVWNALLFVLFNQLAETTPTLSNASEHSSNRCLASIGCGRCIHDWCIKRRLLQRIILALGQTQGINIQFKDRVREFVCYGLLTGAIILFKTLMTGIWPLVPRKRSVNHIAPFKHFER